MQNSATDLLARAFRFTVILVIGSFLLFGCSTVGPEESQSNKKIQETTDQSGQVLDLAGTSDLDKSDQNRDPLGENKWATLDSKTFNFKISYPSSIFVVRDTFTGHVLETQQEAMARLHSSPGPMASSEARRSLSVKFETYGDGMVETAKLVLPDVADKIYPDGTTESFREQEGVYSLDVQGREGFYHQQVRDGIPMEWTFIPKSPSLTFVMTFTYGKYDDYTEQDLMAISEQMISSLEFTR